MPPPLRVEMIHTMSLIHDDLPAWTTTTSEEANPQTTKSTARTTARSLAGDALLAFAFEHVANATERRLPDQNCPRNRELARVIGTEGAVARRVVDIRSEGPDAGSLGYDRLEKWNESSIDAMDKVFNEAINNIILQIKIGENIPQTAKTYAKGKLINEQLRIKQND
ncbi:hypothetical protein Scep_026526 [Stephania cephalantha]|uniref:Uncharacterized protein n=1 Tax=Stephania cephalantha TaxID=152367 RepID=A0AAP0EQM2_9MAGN